LIEHTVQAHTGPFRKKKPPRQPQHPGKEKNGKDKTQGAGRRGSLRRKPLVRIVEAGRRVRGVGRPSSKGGGACLSKRRLQKT